MKTAEIRALSQEELQKKIRADREALLDLRMKKKIATLESPAQFRNLRRSIARMETILAEKQRQLASTSPSTSESA